MPSSEPHAHLRDTALDDSTHLIEARGELDLYSAPELKRVVTAAIDDGRTRVVVDLTQAAFMDSTALGVLIGAIKRLRVRDGVLVLASAQPSILRILEITGLDQVVEVRATRREALEAAGAT